MRSVFFISLLLYLQNFIYTFFSNSIFIPSLIEFFTIFFIVLLISKVNRYKNIIFIFIQSIYFIHFSFISYFGKDVTHIDMYLFITHITDTFETFFDILYIFTTPLIITLAVLIIIFRINLKEVKVNTLLILIPLFILLFYLPKNIYDKNIIFFKELVNLSTLKHKQIIIDKNDKQLKPLKSSNINIVFIIGESLRAKEHMEIKLDIFEEYNYKTIYSAATNTDVVLPLLLNGTNDLQELNLSNNLFKLAKNNNYTTSFISTQSKISLQYITPYLSKDHIDKFNIMGSRDDKDLLNKLHLDKDKPILTIMQMQGSHSPYRYYPSYDKDKNATINYYGSSYYSDKILSSLIKSVKEIKKPTVFIFTSDHGEFIGLNGKYGHNSFEKEIYQVPFVVFNNFDLDIDINKIVSHLDIYNLILWLISYKEQQIKAINPIIVNGTMITGEDGFIKID